MTTPAAMSSSANMEPLSAAVPSENHKRKAVASVKTQDAAESSSLLDEMLVATKIPSPFATQIRNLLTPTQIAELSRINDSLKLQATGSPFLDRFPREIRDKIYGVLEFLSLIYTINRKFCKFSSLKSASYSLFLFIDRATTKFPNLDRLSSYKSDPRKVSIRRR